MKKIQYMDMIERAFSAYTLDELHALIETNEKHGVTEHGFPRVASVLGLLIADGRQVALYPEFVRMMDLSCHAAHAVKVAGGAEARLTRQRGNAGNDFFVKELLFALSACERVGIAAEHTPRWRAELARVVPLENYKEVGFDRRVPIANWGAYNLAGEYVRLQMGLCDTAAYIEDQLPYQLDHLAENGMYRDPHEPMLYDLATRAQFAVMLHFGYDGAHAAVMSEALRRAGLDTLKAQSVTGEIPFGGRSNQFLFNEAYLCACMEFEACRYRRTGDPAMAAACKRSAALAFSSIGAYMARNPDKHVKNAFPKDSPYGCEPYAYFDKYMISLGSFLYLAYLMADDSIEEGIAPCERGGYVWESPACFHKVCAACGEYFIELDTCADPAYDATGLGRIHRRGVYSHLGLSCPFPQSPNYAIADAAYPETENPFPCAITPVWHTAQGETALSLPRADLAHTLTVLTEGEEAVSFRLRYTAPSFVGCTYIEEEYCLTESGLRYTATADGEGQMSVRVPALLFDGARESDIFLVGGQLEVRLDGACYRVKSADSAASLTSHILKNRGGIYRAVEFSGSRSVCLELILEK